MMAPVVVVDVEITEPFCDRMVDARYRGASVLFRWRGLPVQQRWVPVINSVCRAVDQRDALLEDPGALLDEAIVSALLTAARDGSEAPSVNALLASGPEWDEPDTYPTITVAICTRERPTDLVQALESLAELPYPHLEVLVVDNAPESDATRRVAEGFTTPELSLRYVTEPRKGLDWARNRAVLECRSEILAFLDDDATVDGGWAHGIADAFSGEEGVGAVTGPVIAAELETEAQIAFERNGGFSKGFRRKWLTRTPDGGSFGTGANMAFRSEIFKDVGLFDPALDVGTPTGGGGDVEMFWRVTAAGYTVRYEPRALVWHRHRRTMVGLERQLMGYSGAVHSFFHRAELATPQHGDEVRKANRLHGRWLFKVAKDAVWEPGPFSPRFRLQEALGYRDGVKRYEAAVAKARQDELEHGLFSEGCEVANMTVASADSPDDSLLSRIGLGWSRSSSATDEDTTEFDWPTQSHWLDLSDLDQPVSGTQECDAVHLNVGRGSDLLTSFWVMNHHRPVSARRVAHAVAHQARIAALIAEREPGTRAVVGAPAEGRIGRATWRQAIGVIAQYLELDLSSETLAMAEDAVGVAPPLEPTTSIVIPTMDRPEQLDRCLESLAEALRQTPVTPAVEVLVVDNNPESGLTRTVVERHDGVTYLEEPTAGASRARNTGALLASGDVIVFIDDDIIVSESWLQSLIRPLARADVGAVCGRVVAWRLATESERAFEKHASLDRGPNAWVATADEFFEQPDATPTWLLGASCNFAVRRETLEDSRVGMFEETLGPGTPAAAGEDIYLFYRILKAGYSIAYEPEALVRHGHRVETDSLKDQFRGYYVGHSAYHLSTLLRDGDLRSLRQAKVMAGLIAKNVGLGRNRWDRLPPELARAQNIGLITGVGRGVGAFLRSREGIQRMDLERKRMPAAGDRYSSADATPGTSDAVDTSVR